MNHKLPDFVRVPFSGAVEREGAPLCPHSMAFPAAMVSLQVLMGMRHDTHIIEAHNMQWRSDHDYYATLALSGEGARFLFDAAEYFRFRMSDGAQPVRDCFEMAGIPVQLVADGEVKGIDGVWESEQALQMMVLKNLCDGFPVLLLGRTMSDRVLLAIGYENGGESLVAWTFAPGADMTNKTFACEDCQFIQNWWKGTDAVMLVRGVLESPADEKKKIILERALLRAEKDLRAQQSAPYGVNVNYYDDWIGRLSDDARYAGDLTGRPGIDPEIWDLAERRCYMGDFLDDAGRMLQTDALRPGIKAMAEIHSNMWRVNSLCEEDEGHALASASVRGQIIAIVEKCRALDGAAADAIGAYFKG